jgi:hypothetical protein
MTVYSLGFVASTGSLPGALDGAFSFAPDPNT